MVQRVGFCLLLFDGGLCGGFDVLQNVVGGEFTVRRVYGEQGFIVIVLLFQGFRGP